MRFSLEVTVHPGSKHTSIENDKGLVRVHLTAPAVEGKANAALCKLLSGELGVPKTAITIQRGEHGRKKVIFVEAERLPEPYLSMCIHHPGRQP
ncbi:MAG TPA: DUF167 domain-containing protein [Spirochaetota bacterium]|nr:DUF167 domain-containing protein [Spirochaetota bacterium]HPH02005.1 DUF167 domain-containing protein [Spirochaetota bacterium]HPN83064.1 DUF167 domain-containing protein [Spirochaetota bacterium]